MVYALVQDVAASWQEYRHVTPALVEPAPAGLLLHAAGPTDEGVRIIDVWESEQHWQRFQTERLQPAVAVLGDAARIRRTVREFRPAHVVVGAPHPNPADRVEQKEEP